MPFTAFACLLNDFIAFYFLLGDFYGLLLVFVAFNCLLNDFYRLVLSFTLLLLTFLIDLEGMSH